MMRTITVVAFVLTVSAASLQADIALKDSDVVMFFGDRLVQRALYPTQVESFIRAKYPRLGTQFLVNARGNETPETLQGRLARDVFQIETKPTVAVLCFGSHLTHRKALQAGQADEFGQALEKLTAKLAEQGCRIVLMTPQSADEAKNRQLRQIKFNAEVLTPVCDQIKKVAEAGNFALIDWYAASEKVRTERQEKVPGFALTQDGLTPTPEAQALAATLLLEHWGAAPIKETIELDWATGQVASSVGTVTARKNDEGGYDLSLQDFPMPWAGFTGRGARMSEDWYAAKMNQITLTVANTPEIGMMLGDSRRKFPVLPVLLQRGFNLAIMEPMITTEKVADVWRFINTKNRLWNKWILEMAKLPEHPQLIKAHTSLVETYLLFYQGYHEILSQAPRRLSLTLTLNPISPAVMPDAASQTDPRLRKPDPADPADHPVPDEARKPTKVVP